MAITNEVQRNFVVFVSIFLPFPISLKFIVLSNVFRKASWEVKIKVLRIVKQTWHKMLLGIKIFIHNQRQWIIFISNTSHLYWRILKCDAFALSEITLKASHISFSFNGPSNSSSICSSISSPICDLCLKKKHKFF